jgi:dolichyl-diphosphooligosaccharide--protein glycosyltransferase
MSEPQEGSLPDIVYILRTHYPKAVLSVVVGVMLWIRLQAYDQFIRGGEVYLSGNDAWYHLRQVTYTARNWPSTMQLDPWTGFPTGFVAGQFGTLFDQLIATAALIIGLGDPSQELIARTVLVAPAVFGALVALPTYAIGKRLGGRLGGMFAAIVLMLLPGTFLRRGLVGFTDHNIAEPLFMLTAVFVTMIALTVAHRERPVWELVVDRDINALRGPLKWSVLAGVAIAFYMWVWPPGVLLIGITGVYVFVQMLSAFTSDDSPEHIAFVAGVSMPIVAVLMAVQISQPGFSVTGFTLLQVLLPLAVGGGAVFLAWLARVWGKQNLERTGYPVAAGGLVAVSLALLSIVLPGLLDNIVGNLLNTVGFSAGAESRTIGEAQPFLDPGILQRRGLTASGRIVSEYGLAFFSGLLASVWLVAKPLITAGDARKLGYAVGSLGVIALIFLVPAIPDGLGGAFGIESSLISLLIVSGLALGAILQADYEPEILFILVWAAFITSAAFTQVRFNYYLAPGVAIMNAYLVGQLVNSKYLGISGVQRLRDIDGYQALAVIATVLLILGPVLLVPISVGGGTTQTSWEAAENTGPGSVTVWDESLGWMQTNTPEEGNLGGAGNTDQLEYYEKYQLSDDFEYPAGAYGVMSWWDYGHWITVRGERIPVANPFQQNANVAANFLLAPNETQSENVLTSQSTEGNRTRYVMVDWQMATPGSKFGAPTVFYDAEENVSRSDFLRTMYRFDDSNRGQFLGTFPLRTDRFYDSTMTKLYYYHGSARAPSPIVVDWEPRQVQTGSGEGVTLPSNPQGQDSFVRTFDNMSAAEAYVEEDGTAQIGGLGSFPTQRVEALEHYRLVRMSQTTARDRILRTVGRGAQIAGANPRATVPSNPAWLKTFERVPGATIEGSGAPANTTVTASTELRIPTTNSTFTYTQQAETNDDGEFEMTVPYATADYDEYGPENGYTDVSVRATSPYVLSTPAALGDNGSIVTYRANLSVPEGQVNGDESGTVSVELERNAEELSLGGGSGGERSDDESGSGTQSTLHDPAVVGEAARAD